MRFTKLFLTTALLASVSMVGAQDKGKGKGGGKGFQLPPMIHITIADFPDGGHIPTKYTCAASPPALRRRFPGPELPPTRRAML